MKQIPFWSRTIAMITALSVGAIQLTGCAAGNFGATRSVAHWNQRFSLLPRIIVYIALVVIPIYPLAMLFDMLLNNTLEFWTGRPIMNAKNQTFEKNGYRIEVAHSLAPLRKTVITAYNKAGQVESVSELRETAGKTVEVYVNGRRVAEVDAPHDNEVIITTADRQQLSIPLSTRTESNLDDPSRRAATLSALREQLKDIAPNLLVFEPAATVANHSAQ